MSYLSITAVGPMINLHNKMAIFRMRVFSFLRGRVCKLAVDTWPRQCGPLGGSPFQRFNFRKLMLRQMLSSESPETIWGISKNHFNSIS